MNRYLSTAPVDEKWETSTIDAKIHSNEISFPMPKIKLVNI